MTRDEFKTRAPEWKTARDERIDAALTQATARTDASLFGASTDDAVFFLAAHLLAVSPSGKAARLEGGKVARTLYLDERERLEREAAACLGVSLVTP